MAENIENKPKISIVARINVLLTLLLLVVIMGFAYYGFMFKQHMDTQIRMLDIATVHNGAKLINLEGRVEVLQDDLSHMSQGKVEIYQISELVALANQVLVVYGDVNGCLRLLNYAKYQLSTNNNPEFDNLKVALGYDLEHLDSVNVIDKVTLSGEIDGLNDAVTAMHLVRPMANADKSIKMEDSKWQRFLANTKDTLYSLVSISKTSGAVILVPSAENVAKENIHFDLFSAKVALLGHDEKSWTYNLQNANYYLDTYFKEYAGADRIKAEIESLLIINIANDTVNIDATIKAINKLKALN